MNNIYNNNDIPQAHAVPISPSSVSLTRGTYTDANGNIIGNFDSSKVSQPVEEHQTRLPPNRQYSRNYQIVPNETNTKEYLNKNNWPEGLQNLLLQNIVKIPFRIFIVDDSGSMSTNDGKRLVGSGADTKIIRCSRWTEMAESIKFHASLAYSLNMPSEFRLLNSAPPIRIGGSEGNPEGVAILNTFLNESPGGGTPLCRHIREVISLISELEPSLRSLGQKVSITIMTDGESSDGDLAQGVYCLSK